MKRRVVLLLLLLVAGAIVNVGVAWGCELWGSSPDFFSKGVPFRPLNVGETWFRSVPVGWPTAEERGLVALFARTVVYTTETREDHGFQPHEIFHNGQTVIQAGMPLRAVEYETRVSQSRLHARFENVGDAGEVPLWLIPDDYKGRRFPLRPIWPGFAINTGFYALILWLLFAAPFALRRHRRIKRGLCPKCAYDLRGSVRGYNATACPECGVARRSSPT